MKGVKGVKYMKLKKVNKIKLSELEKEKLKTFMFREKYKRHLNEMKNEKEVRMSKYYVKDFNVRNMTFGSDQELKNVLEKTEKKYYQVNKGLRHLRFNREINNIYYLYEKEEMPEIILEENKEIFLYENGILHNMNVKFIYKKGGVMKIKFRDGRNYKECKVKPIRIEDMNETFILNGKKFKRNVLENYVKETGRNVYVKDNV